MAERADSTRANARPQPPVNSASLRQRVDRLIAAMELYNALDAVEDDVAASDALIAPAEPAPRDPLSSLGPVSIEVDMAVLRTLDMTELRNFRDAMHTMSDVVAGLCCQPRFASVSTAEQKPASVAE